MFSIVRDSFECSGTLGGILICVVTLRASNLQNFNHWAAFVLILNEGHRLGMCMSGWSKARYSNKDFFSEATLMQVFFSIKDEIQDCTSEGKEEWWGRKEGKHLLQKSSSPASPQPSVWIPEINFSSTLKRKGEMSWDLNTLLRQWMQHFL